MSLLTVTTGDFIRSYKLHKEISFGEIQQSISPCSLDSFVLFKLENGGTLIIGRDVCLNSIIDIYNEASENNSDADRGNSNLRPDTL